MGWCRDPTSTCLAPPARNHVETAAPLDHLPSTQRQTLPVLSPLAVFPERHSILPDTIVSGLPSLRGGSRKVSVRTPGLPAHGEPIVPK